MQCENLPCVPVCPVDATWKRPDGITTIDYDSHTPGRVRKCHFCQHRLEKAQLPSCVTSCIGRAMYFCDLNDPDSLVTELIQQNQVQTLLPHLGTMPRVFFIV